MISEFIIKEISGFAFVKAGEFQFSDKPCQFKSWASELVLNLFDDRFKKANETVYLIKCEDEIRYVGEFTYNLENRWISRNHVNHHMYNHILNSLKEGNLLSLWLAISPYCEIAEHGELNVSKALEQHIMRKYQPPWNLRNKQSESKEWRVKNCIRLDSFIAKP